MHPAPTPDDAPAQPAEAAERELPARAAARRPALPSHRGGTGPVLQRPHEPRQLELDLRPSH